MSKKSFFSGPAVALAVVLVLGGYVYYDLSTEKQLEARKNLDLKIFKIKQDQVQMISLKTESQNIELERSIDGWLIKSPIRDDANSNKVESFLESFYKNSFAESIENVKSNSAEDLKKYNLENEKNLKLIISDNSGQTDELRVSDLKNFENKAYAINSISEKIYLLSSDLYSNLQTTLTDFRIKKLFRGSMGAIEALHYEFEKTCVSVVKSEDWQLNQKACEKVQSKTKLTKKAEIDLNKTREFIRKISEIEISNYLVEGAPTATDFKKFSIGQKVGFINVKTTSKDYSYTIYKSSNTNPVQASELYVVSKEPKFLLRLNPESKSNLLQMTVDSIIKSEEKKDEVTDTKTSVSPDGEKED